MYFDDFTHIPSILDGLLADPTALAARKQAMWNFSDHLSRETNAVVKEVLSAPTGSGGAKKATPARSSKHVEELSVHEDGFKDWVDEDLEELFEYCIGTPPQTDLAFKNCQKGLTNC
jgi:hypothetical protein